MTLQRGYDLPKGSRVNGKFKLVSSSGVIDTHNEYKVTGPGLYTGRSGSVGSTFYEAENFWPLNTTLYVKDFHGNNPRYCYWLLKNFDLKSYAGGTGVPTLNRNLVHEVAVSFHDKAEQSQIAQQIDKLESQVQILQENYKRKLADLEELRQSILKREIEGKL